MATPKRKTFKDLFKRSGGKQIQTLTQTQTQTNEPWRPIAALTDGWEKQYSEKLLAEIEEIVKETLKSTKSNTVNIMMLGYVQSGKSSTINSIFSILHKRISAWAKSGASGTSYTQKYQSYAGFGALSGVVLYDIMGIEMGENQGILNADVKSCIAGEVEVEYDFNPKTCKKKDDTVQALDQQEIHCVMYCVDAESIFEEVVPGFDKKMQEVENELKVVAQDRIVLVTKIDNICAETKKDIRKIFFSKNVKDVVEKASSVFRVNKNQVFPIQNYVEEIEVDPYKSIPLLLALRQAIYFGIDYLKKQADKGEKQTES